MRIGIPVALMAVLALLIPAAASALPLGETESFTGATEPFATAAGPDGNVWFTDPGSGKVGRITPGGTITEYAGFAGTPYGIAAGPDGKIWFTEIFPSKIGRCDPASCESTIEEFSTGLQATPFPTFITAGPDGNMWFVDSAVEFGGENKIGRITMAGAITEYGTANGLNAGGQPCSITGGPDGNVWFGDCGAPRAIGKITPTGTILSEYELTPSDLPASIARGSDGNLWFTRSGGSEGVGRITPSGTVTNFPTPNGSWSAIAAGPDGNLWVKNGTALNEEQRIEVKAAASLGGTYKLKFESCETGALEYKATSAQIKTALTGLPCIGSGNANVAGVGSTSPVKRTASFVGGLARTDVEQMTCVSALTGTTPECLITTIQESVRNKLMRITPAGATTQFELKPAIQVNTAPANSLALGPDGNLWLSEAGAAKALVKFGTGPLTLSVNTTGTGEGTVTSSPAGIECPSDCEQGYETSTEVTLTATAESGSKFTGWTEGAGTCTGMTSPCVVTMSEIHSVTADFGLIEEFKLEVDVDGTGTGEVTSSPAGIDCPGDCEEEFEEGTVVELTPVADAGSEFVEWSGACTSSGACEVTMSEGREVVATFDLEEFALTVSIAGSGSGMVTGSPGSIDCSPVCSDVYEVGTEVTLTASPASGSSFAGWSGACSGSGACEVTMSQARSVTATFDKVPPPNEEKQGEKQPSAPSPAPGQAAVASTAKVKAGKAQLKLSCKGEGACKGSLKLVAKLKSGKGKAKNTTIGQGSFSLATGASTTVKIGLNSAAKKALKGGKTLKAKVTGSGVQAGAVKLRVG